MSAIPQKKGFEEQEKSYKKAEHDFFGRTDRRAESKHAEEVFVDPGWATPRVETFSDLSVIVYDSSEYPADHAFLRLLDRYHPGCSIILADEFRGTWYRHFAGGESDVVREKTGHSRSAERVSDTGMGPLLEAIRNCKTKYMVVMLGDSRHPAERILGLVNELRAGREFIISSSFAAVAEDNFTEKDTSKLRLAFAKKRLSYQGMNINDPFAKFFAGETLIVQDMVKRLKKRKSSSDIENILYDLLLNSKRNLSLLEMHYEPYFSPGFMIAQHTGA